MDKCREKFENAYEPNPDKSPFTQVRFNENKQIYEPLNPPINHVARSLNAAWYGWRIRQKQIDELQTKLDAVSRISDDIKSMASGSCGIQFVGRQLEQALKGGDQ